MQLGQLSDIQVKQSNECLNSHSASHSGQESLRQSKHIASGCINYSERFEDEQTKRGWRAAGGYVIIVKLYTTYW